MNQRLRHRPSAALVISIAALVLAASGTAVAAGTLMSGDRLIKKHSLSGNRLRAHAITGAQVNLKKLGTVPHSTNAATAQNAQNARELGGQPSSAYLSSGAVLSSGVVWSFVTQPYAGGNQQFATQILRKGPLSLTGICVEDPSSDTTTGTIWGDSTEGNWLSSGQAQSSFSTVLTTVTTPDGTEKGTTIPYDLETPDGVSLRGQVTIAMYWPDTSKCSFRAYSVS